LFAAIVLLKNENDFPDSEDLSTSDVLGTTLIDFPEPSEETWGELAITLEPGWYALVFGGGLFGANGAGGVLSNSTDIGSPDYIGFLTGFDWGTRLPSKRFFVNGNVVPEPTSLVLLIIGALCIARKRSHFAPR
jgi:hypothetical protein